MSERVMIFDTTLRDGEQAAGSRLGAREKLELARQLAKLKVDVIEAGFPISSPEDFEAVKLISEEIEGPVICGLTRAREEDIDVCAKSLESARRSGWPAASPWRWSDVCRRWPAFRPGSPRAEATA